MREKDDGRNEVKEAHVRWTSKLPVRQGTKCSQSAEQRRTAQLHIIDTDAQWRLAMRADNKKGARGSEGRKRKGACGKAQKEEGNEGTLGGGKSREAKDQREERQHI